MTTQNMTDVRNALFDELKQLRGEKPNLERAKAVREVCKVLVDTARVEVDYILAMGGDAAGSGFIPEAKDELESAPNNGILSVTRHVLEG